MSVASRRPLLVRVGIAFLVAFLVAIPAGFSFVEWSVQPGFCLNCHLMIPYYKSWEDSAHGKKQVSCVQCHYEPGIVETMKGKVMALNMVVKYATGAEGTKPWAQVSDASCMRGGCHSQRLLAGAVKFDMGRVSIPFNHTPHLLEMRGGKKLRCTSCHSQIVQGEHLSVTVTTCFTCHFKGAEADPKMGDCRTCHGPPEKPIDLGGFVFEHEAYLERGVTCESCHPGTTVGTGEVPEKRCLSCHGVVEHLQRYGETEFIHAKHVTTHKVDCLQCHTEITHKLRPRPGAEVRGPASPASDGGGNCAACHSSTHGVGETFFRGEGGRGAPPTPSAMWLARVDCSGCHRPTPGVLGSPGKAVPAKEFACLSCHGPAFAGMMGRWQEAYGTATEAVAAALEEALPKASEPGERRALEDAAHDVALVRADGSRGVHNPWYARKLLESAHARSEGVLRAADPARPASPFPLDPPFATNMTCALLCHVGIEKQDIRSPGTRFEHRRHLGKAGDCSACHSTGSHGRPGEEHGVVKPEARDCTSCHHGPKAPDPAAGRDCASCHVAEDRFLRGQRADGSRGDAMMAEVSCDACHGEPPAKPVLASVQPQCIACHEEDPSYGAMAADWSRDARAWMEEAEARLRRIRKPSEDRERAEAVLLRLRFSGPAHNILLFEEEKEAFDEAASAAEK